MAFFFNDAATPEIYTLSLHDALPIYFETVRGEWGVRGEIAAFVDDSNARSEEHTSELQSRLHLVCRLLLEKKKRLRRLPHRALPKRSSRRSTAPRFQRCRCAPSRGTQ